MCALAAQVSETSLKFVLDEDRVPKHLAALDAQIASERDTIMCLPGCVFQFFGDLCGRSEIALRNGCYQSVLVQVGYGEHRLRLARALPWSLVGGDVEQKLSDLKAGPSPDELVTWKIYCLLHVGVPSSTLAAGVDLLGEMPFTTRAVEQGHAVSALLMKYHKLYTSSVMTSRTVVSTVKQLVDGQVRRQGRRICKLRSRLERLRKSDPSKIHGRHVYLGALLQRARARTDRHGWHAVRRQVVKGHSRWFS